MRGLTLVDGKRAVTLAGGDEVASSIGQVVHRQPFYVCRQAVFAHGGNFRPLSTILRLGIEVPDADRLFGYVELAVLIVSDHALDRTTQAHLAHRLLGRYPAATVVDELKLLDLCLRPKRRLGPRRTPSPPGDAAPPEPRVWRGRPASSRPDSWRRAHPRAPKPGAYAPGPGRGSRRARASPRSPAAPRRRVDRWWDPSECSGCRAVSLRDGCRDLFRPARLLALEDAARNLDECAGAMQGKLAAPPRRDVGEVLVDEYIRGTTRLIRRQRVETDPGREVRDQVRGVPHGIAEDDRVEVDEAHPLARDEDVVGLQVAMDRRRTDLRETGPNRRCERFDLRPQIWAGPPHETRRPVHVGELVGEGMPLGERQVVLIERCDGPGNRAQRRGPVAPAQQDLLQRWAASLLQREGA